MLTQLHIENIAVIERVDIDFFDGLGVFTGETGAGKSVMIDAINAVLEPMTADDFKAAILRDGHCESPRYGRRLSGPTIPVWKERNRESE